MDNYTLFLSYDSRRILGISGYSKTGLCVRVHGCVCVLSCTV